MKILITGCAGFIGFHLSLKYLKLNKKVLGIDNLNSYYDIKIKKNRLKILKRYKNFKFIKGDLKEEKILKKKINKQSQLYISFCWTSWREIFN